jgi:hypothetical protein
VGNIADDGASVRLQNRRQRAPIESLQLTFQRIFLLCLVYLTLSNVNVWSERYGVVASRIRARDGTLIQVRNILAENSMR